MHGPMNIKKMLCLSTCLWHKYLPKNSVTLYVAANLLAFNMAIRVDVEIIFSIMPVFSSFPPLTIFVAILQHSYPILFLCSFACCFH